MKKQPGFLWALCILVTACSFDYGNTQPDHTQPDIIMEDVEYVRVRQGDPLIRFDAERAERYEERKLMNLEKFSFAEFENHGAEINAGGNAGEASIELDSGNILLSGGVKIEVNSEDITIETTTLSWQDKERILSGEENDEVEVNRSDGTSFIGKGFTANARERTWTFSSGAEGSYVDAENEEAEEDALFPAAGEGEGG